MRKMESTAKLNAASNTATEQESFKVVEWNIRPGNDGSSIAPGLDNSCGCDCGCDEMR